MQPDLSVRARPVELPEWMDQPCTYEDFRACLQDLKRVMRWTLGARPTLRWLETLAPQETPLRIVDVGCGGGDMLREIARWSHTRGVQVELTGIDLNPYAIRAANDFAEPGEAIDFVTSDVFSYAPQEGIDVVVSSLMTHHLEAPELVRLLGWMDRVARRGWFVNDLYRGAAPLAAYQVMMQIGSWHPFVRHDGPVSIRRGFREKDWQSLCASAGIAGAKLERWTPGRLCVGRVK